MVGGGFVGWYERTVSGWYERTVRDPTLTMMISASRLEQSFSVE